MQEKSGAWPNGQTPLCLQSEQSIYRRLEMNDAKIDMKISNLSLSNIDVSPQKEIK